MNLDDAHFRSFAENLEKAIARVKQPLDQDLLAHQKEQIESLVGLEGEFRKTLLAHRSGPSVYRDFVHFVCDERRNILAARPYFRERQGVFTKQISRALKRRAEKSLYRFHFNYQFVLFVMAQRDWDHHCRRLVELAEKIREVRTALVVENMPLAISRAKIFYSRTPPSQLSYMDLIQIACEGLMSAVDKFVLPFSRVFRGVAIGRMVGNFIENYSETLVHFYPVDKRKIYRANKLVGKNVGEVDFNKVADSVNEGVEDPAHRTNPSEIADLMSAASCVSADAESPSDDGNGRTTVLSRYAAPDRFRPDVVVELDDSLSKLGASMTALTVAERKFLKMKGVQLDSLQREQCQLS